MNNLLKMSTQEEGSKLKAALYRLPKEVLIEKILPDFALAHVELSQCKAERDLLSLQAPAHKLVKCLEPNCQVVGLFVFLLAIGRCIYLPEFIIMHVS